MTAVPPFIPHPSQPTAVDLCNGYTYVFPPPSTSSTAFTTTATPSTPPARLAVFDPQLLWERLRPSVEHLFPLSSVVLRGKTGQVTISNINIQVVSIHSSPLQSVTSSTATALRSAASWQHLPYVHVYLLASASLTVYLKHHRLLIAPFISAFTDAPSSTATAATSPPSITAASSTSPSSAVVAGSDVLLLYCMHVDERRDSKNERKLLDKLRSDWGKDTVVPLVLGDEWWVGWSGEGGGAASGAGGGGSGGEEGVMSSISSLLSSTSSSSTPSVAVVTAPPLSASLLPILRARFTSSFSTRCDSLHSIVHSLLLLSAYPHWPFTRFLLVQFTAARVHCQFGLYVEALRLLDEAAAVMAGSTVQQLIGDAATQNKVKLRYLYDEGSSSPIDDSSQHDDEEAVELFYNRLSLLQCERLLYAQQSAILRRMGRIEEVVERGEALVVRWMEREGWEVWGWLIGCVVDVWSRGEREVRERHADERRSRGNGGGDEEGKKDDRDGADEDGKEAKQKRHRLSTTTARPRSTTPERRRKPAASTSATATSTATDDKQFQQVSDTVTSTAAPTPAPVPSSSSTKSGAHKRAQTQRHLAAISVRGNHVLTAQLRHLHAQRVSSMFGCINRLMEERKRVEREKGRFDVMDDESRSDSKRRRDRLRDDREERERRLAEWKERGGEDYMLLLDDEVTGGEAVYEQRQRKVEYAMQHSCLFPLLLHALLYFTSPSAAHSYHFISLYCHAFSALSLPSFASSLYFYLSSVYSWQRWIGLAVREMEWRLREERDARRWVGMAHSVLMLLGLKGGTWLDVRIRELSEEVTVQAEQKEAFDTATEQADWFDQPANEVLPTADASSLLALFRLICIHHLPSLPSLIRQPSSAPVYHRCRTLDAGQDSAAVLPLPRPSIPSPAALTSIILSSARASPPPSTAPIAFVASLSSLVRIESLTVTIHPCFSPLHLCLRLVCASSGVFPLASVVLDEFAFTVSLQRGGERMEIDCEYHQQVRLTGGEVWLHAVMVEEGGQVQEMDSVEAQHMCVLSLATDDHGALLSLLSLSADDDTPLLVSVSHMWLRYHRLHLLPLDRQVIDNALTVNIDYATTLSASTISSSTSATQFLSPLFTSVGAYALSPRSPHTSAPLSLTYLPSSQPALLDSSVSIVFILRTAAPLPSCRFSLISGGSGVEPVGDVSMVASSEDSVRSEERVVQVVDGTALLGPLSSSALCVLECRITAPSSRSITAEAIEANMTARVSWDSVSAAVDLPFTVRFVSPFIVSCSLLHLGHRLYVCAGIRSCQSGLTYRFDGATAEWSKRWSILSTAGEAELAGAVMAGGSDVQLMYEVESENLSAVDDDNECDAILTVRASVTNKLNTSASLSPTSSTVVSHLPLRLPLASITPPLLHLILSSPSSARVGQPITLSLTIILSATAASSDSTGSSVQLLCYLSPSSSFYMSGHSTFTVSLSSGSPSYNHSVVLLPLQAGVMVLPSIAVKERRSVAGTGSSSDAGEQWMDVVDGRLRCHFGVERVRVLPSGGTARCELEREMVQAH